MRTTLDIDLDVLEAAREIATARRSSIGAVLSELAREALHPPEGEPTVRNDVPLLAPREGESTVTSGVVNRLRDDEVELELTP